MVVADCPYKGKEEAFRSLLFRQVEIYRGRGFTVGAGAMVPALQRWRLPVFFRMEIQRSC